MPKTTIITCTQLPTDRLGYLEEAWNSLRGQTQQDFRWILALDAPQNPVPAALDDPRITVIPSLSHLGQAAARNRALQVIGTPYLCTLDDDDTLTPNSLELRETALDADPGLGWVAGFMADMAPDGTVAGRWEQPARAGSYPPGKLLDLWADPSRWFVALTHTFTMRADLVREIGGWRPEGAIEDVGVIARLSETSRGEFLDEVFYNWRKHPRQASNGLDAEIERVSQSRHIWRKARDLNAHRVAA